jgi:hypothetical protein
MNKIKWLAVLAIVSLSTTIMSAQATRTWVSGVGDDANPCSRTAPCKTFAGAISKTAPGGEIDALDPGGFGALTITKSITLDGGGGQVASVLVAGTNGIVVAAGATDVVIIRNLRLDGLRGGGNANAGLSGIRFISGQNLDIENDVIFGFNNNCIDIANNQNSSVHIINTITKNCGGDGVRATTSSGLVTVGIDDSQIMVNGQNGVEAADHSRVTINRSFIQHSAGSGVIANSPVANDAQALIYDSYIDYNGTAIQATGGNGTSTFTANSHLGFNGTVFGVSGGTDFSFGNNRQVSNGSVGTVTATPAANTQ